MKMNGECYACGQPLQVSIPTGLPVAAVHCVCGARYDVRGNPLRDEIPCDGMVAEGQTCEECGWPAWAHPWTCFTCFADFDERITRDPESNEPECNTCRRRREAKANQSAKCAYNLPGCPGCVEGKQ